MLRAVAASFATAALVAPRAVGVPAPPESAGILSDGAPYAYRVPASWNGTLLLYSHGYRAPGVRREPSLAVSDRVRDALLAQGYALAASSYAADGWAVADALRDQMELLRLVQARVGEPKRTIAWGFSMGGLITVALVQQHPERFAGGVSYCGVLAGTTATWNRLLDAEIAFAAVVAPDASPAVVRVATASANEQRIRTAYRRALATPDGRARLALVAAFGDAPARAEGAAAPAPGDTDGAIRGLLSWLPGAILPFAFGARGELEHRAGGNLSTSVRDSYAKRFARLPDRAIVTAAYRAAGIDLAADLAAMDAASTVRADPRAAAYAHDFYDPIGRLPRPLLTVHTIADGLVPAAQERAFAAVVAPATRDGRLVQRFVDRAGHCAFTAAETVAGLDALATRATAGTWPDVSPAGLNAAATALGIDGAAFIDRRPDAFYDAP